MSNHDGPGGTIRLERPDNFRADLARAIKTRLAPALRILTGADAGTTVRLDHTIMIGRDPAADISLRDHSVSFHHARIEDRGDAWAIVDLGSTNGTLVDDKRCNDTILAPMSRIEIGQTLMRFEVQDENEQQYDAIVERLISVDDLTGLYVRRRFDRELAQMLAAATPSTRIAVLVMDLDGIKKLNDANGHLYGAHVIGEAGRRIGAACASYGGKSIASRFGGDEYVVAVIDLDAEQALEFASQLRVSIADGPYYYEGRELNVGVSVGIAAFPDDGLTVEAIFQAADAAMYRAKEAGKNRVSR